MTDNNTTFTPAEIRRLKHDEAVYGARQAGEFPTEGKRFKMIDLFCGAGGMTLGFTPAFNHHFEPVWANDFNKYCVETYNANFGDHCVEGDLADLLAVPGFQVPKADLVVGGPPCQGFSLLNKNRANDPRNQLWRPYLEVVEKSGAKVFIIENVPQLLGTFEHGEIVGTAEKLGFRVRHAKLCAADYGVPQVRYRAIIIGSRVGDPSCIFPPRRTHANPKERENGLCAGDYLRNPQGWRTVRDAIADLPPPAGTEIRDTAPPLDLHFGRNPTEKSKQRYRAIPDEGMNRFDLQRIAPELTPACWLNKKSGSTDLFGRLWWDRPSVTIRTEFYKPEKGRYLHPQQHRPITHREAARFQGFPDDFLFKGSKVESARQIGNAVPPPMAARLADIAHVLLTLGQGDGGN